jgi:hypothetical protein
MSVRVTLEVSVGELVDRISILELKHARLPEPARSAVARDLAAARTTLTRHCVIDDRLTSTAAALSAVNRELWDTEECLRACERNSDFDARFVSLARSVYLCNDRRAALKRRIDELSGSELSEHKSHPLPEP